MQMTDKEIYRSYNQAGRKKQQIRILAELNDCDRKDIQAIIDRMDNMAKPAAKRGRPKQQEPEQQEPVKYEIEMPRPVIYAVRERVKELEEKTERMREAIKNTQDSLDWMMAEWAELKEWQQEYDSEDVTCKQ